MWIRVSNFFKSNFAYVFLDIFLLFIEGAGDSSLFLWTDGVFSLFGYHKSIYSQFRLWNFDWNLALTGNFFRHFLLLFQSLRQNVDSTVGGKLFGYLFLLLGNLRHSQALSVIQSSQVSAVVDLLELGWLFACTSVDIMRQHLISWIGRLDISLAVGMECWLAKVGGKAGVSQPPGCWVYLIFLIFQGFLLSRKSDNLLFLRLGLSIILLDDNMLDWSWDAVVLWRHSIRTSQEFWRFPVCCSFSRSFSRSTILSWTSQSTFNSLYLKLIFLGLFCWTFSKFPILVSITGLPFLWTPFHQNLSTLSIGLFASA